jgi:NAD(P)-dependent dehydrogenase (short-subunit alcohol dehydrogenase family)
MQKRLYPRGDKIRSMETKPLQGKSILITGAARRVGRIFAMACGRAGADVIIHHSNSHQQALNVQKELASFGTRSWVPLYGLVNSASIFEPLTLQTTTLDSWNQHLNINLTAPFLLSQAFAKHTTQGRIVNILDWRALRPGADHFPYTVTKAALAAMTRSLAAALAPNITVNGLALGAILPPADNPSAAERVIESVPAHRWSEAKEVEESLLFLLSGPSYITGEIIHLDGGRHLV